MIKSFYKSDNRDFTIVKGDCFDVLPQFDFKFDMIFADPPYFLSNGGISYQAGKIVCVDKGDWDKGGSPESIMEFNRKWLSLCREKLKDNGTIWISGTHHNIFSIANVLTELGYKILNVITWAKTNPPPNISCRFFTYSTEFTDEHDWILDPFAGSSTTGIAANLCGRRFFGIEKELNFINLGKARRIEIAQPVIRQTYIQRISDLSFTQSATYANEPDFEYGLDIPF